jgi:membrane-bound lytic murein transglycosylase MltF
MLTSINTTYTRRLMKIAAAPLLVATLVFAAAGCSSSPSPEAGTKPGAAAPETPAAAPEVKLLPPPVADDPIPDVPSPYDALPEGTRTILDKPFTGDFDEMVERRLIRAGVVFNRTQYFIENGVQKGSVYESIKLFEDEVNKRLKTGVLKVNVAFVPLMRDQLFPALESGKVDFIAGAITITPERLQHVAFSNPTRTGVNEIVVLGAEGAPLTTAEDLSGREVFVRKSSSYYQSLAELNKSLVAKGRPPAVIKEAPEALEDDDLLEMVNAGLVESVVVDDYLVAFWSQALPNLRPQKGAVLRSGGEIAIGVRKNNPKMLKAANIWIKEYGPRTAFGNMMQRRYLQDATYVKNAAAEAERKKLLALVEMFKRYGDKYGVDYLLMAAQGFQESRLDQSVKSRVGAIGVMQVMPATGKDLAVGDITQIEPNIHAGVKYFRFMVDTFYKDEPMTQLDKGLMTLASYNAGPGRIRTLRKEAARRGLDPNVWFGNVEQVVSEKIGRETVTYVSNIYKYYVAYHLVLDRRTARATAVEAVKAAQ